MPRVAKVRNGQAVFQVTLHQVEYIAVYGFALDQWITLLAHHNINFAFFDNAVGAHIQQVRHQKCYYFSLYLLCWVTFPHFRL